MKKVDKKGFTLIELMIVIAIIAIIAAIAIPGLLQSQRAANERNASASMKTLTSAEADFRANDRDANKVNDFWTYDVKGLYTFSGHSAQSVNTMIKLIELSVAAADASPVATNGTGCINITTVATTAAKSGYWYQAMTSDSSGTAAEVYATNTAGTNEVGGTVTATQYNTSKFGFICYPDSTSSGKFAYAVNENNTIFRRALSVSVKASTTNPPGISTNVGIGSNNWPTDTDLKSFWGKMD